MATATQLGSGQNAAATVTFSGLTQSIAGSTTSLWVTYDIASGATLGNFVDAQIASGGITITASGGATAPGTQPASTLNPAGNRKIDYCNDLYSIGCNNLGIGDVSVYATHAITITKFIHQEFLSKSISSDSNTIFFSIKETTHIYYRYPSSNDVFDGGHSIVTRNISSTDLDSPVFPTLPDETYIKPSFSKPEDLWQVSLQ